MKKILSLIAALLMTISSLSIVTVTGMQASKTEYAWVLVEINDYENADKWAANDAHESYIVTYHYSRGTYGASTTYEGDDPYGQGRSGTLAVRATFSGMPDMIYPDEPVSLKLTFVPLEDSVVALSFSASASANFDQWDVEPGGITGRAIAFENTNGESSFTITGTRSVSYDETLTATLGSGYEKSRIALRLRFFMGVAMGTNYVYEWKQVKASPVTPAVTAEATQAPDEKTIVFSGQIRDIDNKPMRRMKLNIAAFYNVKEGIQGGTAPDWNYSGASDVKGCYKVEIPVPKGQTNPIQIMIQGTLSCLMPNKIESYTFVDMSERAAQDAILLASWLSVDVADDKYKDVKIIPVSRLLSFRYLKEGAWSFNSDDKTPDFFQTNMVNTDNLAAHSYAYSMLWNAQYVAGYMFKEMETLYRYPLTVEMNWSPVSTSVTQISHFSKDDRTIRLVNDDCGYNDYARYVILHEYGHYFDTMTNGGWYRTTYDKPNVPYNINHAGYMNSDTSDSFIEGFATSFAAIVQKAAHNKNPQMAGVFDLGQEGNYVAWGSNGTHEELAIAVLLYQMFLEFETPLEYWKVLKSDLTDFYAYYQRFEQTLAGNEQALGRLRQIAYSGGLYQMLVGSGRYEYGEPFIDLNQNGKYDSGEPYADLMYEMDDDGNAIIQNPLTEFTTDDLIIGKSADVTRKNRQTTYLQPNSFVYLDGHSVDHLLVTMKYDGEEPIRILMPVVSRHNERKVYIGLLDHGKSGELNISIPGGKTILRADLEKLLVGYRQTIGQNVPLAEIIITPGALAPAGTRSTPTNGDSAASGIMAVFDPDNIGTANDEAAQLALTTDYEAGLKEYETDLLTTQDSNATSEMKNKSVFRLLLIFISILLFAIIVASIIWIVMQNKKTNEKSQYLNQEVRFCASCGTRYNPDSMFCTNCGKQMK